MSDWASIGNKINQQGAAQAAQEQAQSSALGGMMGAGMGGGWGGGQASSPLSSAPPGYRPGDSSAAGMLQPGSPAPQGISMKALPDTGTMAPPMAPQTSPGMSEASAAYGSSNPSFYGR